MHFGNPHLKHFLYNVRNYLIFASKMMNPSMTSFSFHSPWSIPTNTILRHFWYPKFLSPLVLVRLVKTPSFLLSFESKWSLRILTQKRLSFEDQMSRGSDTNCRSLRCGSKPKREVSRIFEIFSKTLLCLKDIIGDLIKTTIKHI